jgi:hypothetical protein
MVDGKNGLDRFYLHHFFVFVKSTMRTDMMRRTHLVTLRAFAHRRLTELVMRSALSLSGLGHSLLWNWH